MKKRTKAGDGGSMGVLRERNGFGRIEIGLGKGGICLVREGKKGKKGDRVGMGVKEARNRIESKGMGLGKEGMCLVREGKKREGIRLGRNEYWGREEWDLKEGD